MTNNCGLATWPEMDESLSDDAAERDFARLQDAVGAVRNLRAEANLNPTQGVPIYAEGAAAGVLQANKAVFESLTRATLLSEQPFGAALSQPLPDLELKLPLTGLVDIDEWRARQEKRLQELQKSLATSKKKLSNDKFVQNAPAIGGRGGAAAGGGG